MKKTITGLFALALVMMLFAEIAAAQEKMVVQSERHNVSRPIRSITPPAYVGQALLPRQIQNKFEVGAPSIEAAERLNFADPMQQAFAGTLAPTIGANFEGANDADNGAAFGFVIVPPDTDGDVGPNHYVQWINLVSEIFDKNGNSLMGPFPGNEYFQGLGGDCQNENSGDPITLYDEEADRWLVSQFAVDAQPYYMCVAISQTGNPMGAYNQYAFSFGRDFPDYPKLGIWGDSYIMTTRDFRNGFSFAGISAIALDRQAMLNGQSATMVRFANAFNSISDGALPADHDGGASFGSGPAVFGAHGADGDTTFELWQLNVDWNNPGGATFSSIPGVTIAAYDGVVPSANQPNGQVLDDLSGFTMSRLNVRDYGTHMSMVGNHTVETFAGTAGIRWYEFRKVGSGNWTLHQQGTFSPDTDDRWMGSIAINANGDIALGYSRSSSTMHPSIYFTGQTADQSGSGVMNIAETQIHAGTGSQSGASRWGDYSRMSVDPVDDVSFWYTTEYYQTTSSFNFKTRIASFQLDQNSGGNNPPVASFSSNCTLLDCNFTDQSTDSDGTIVSWSWDFGDGGSSTQQNPMHTYASNGTYDVMLTVTDDMGAPGSTTVPVTVDDGTAAGQMHVAGLVIEKISAGGPNRQARAVVTVQDGNGQPVQDATVSGTFSFPSPISDESGSGVTGATGVANITSTTTVHNNQFSQVSFCVDDITHNSLEYNPGANGNPSWACPAGPISGLSKNLRLDALAQDVPETFALEQNYPNPFNPTTLINFGMPETAHVSIKVFNMLGQEVAMLVDEVREAGNHTVAFNANDLSAGVYLYTMQTEDFSVTKRMTLLK